MSTVTTPKPDAGNLPIANGNLQVQSLAGVVMMRESDFRELLVEQDDLRRRIREQERALNYFRAVHHAHYELLKDRLAPEDPNWAPPTVEETIDLAELVRDIGQPTGAGA